jgi:hypothetical protein
MLGNMGLHCDLYIFAPRKGVKRISTAFCGSEGLTITGNGIVTSKCNLNKSIFDVYLDIDSVVRKKWITKMWDEAWSTNDNHKSPQETLVQAIYADQKRLLNKFP